MLLAQTRRDRKEGDTRTIVYTRSIWNTRFLSNATQAVLSTYKMAAETHAVRCCFVNLENGRMRACRGRIYRPERPLVLMSLYDAYTCPWCITLHVVGISLAIPGCTTGEIEQISRERKVCQRLTPCELKQGSECILHTLSARMTYKLYTQQTYTIP